MCRLRFTGGSPRVFIYLSIMNRRSVLQFAAASSLYAQGPDPPIRPHALKLGDTVGLITPSTFVSDPDALALAEKTVAYFGLKSKWGKNVRQREGYLGGAVQGRLDDLHAMFRDREVKALFALRGGYGAAQLLDRIDYDLIRSNPKILLAYTDIPSLHLAFQKQPVLVTFHGPVVLSRFTGYTQHHFPPPLFDTDPTVATGNPAE